MGNREIQRELVRDLYGAVLQNQGRGLYVSMELLAILRGSIVRDGEPESGLLPESGRRVAFRRPTHDFARRLLGGDFDARDDMEHLTPGSRAALKDLLSGLQLPVPGRRTEPGDWRKRHFFPFPPDLIHYDALVKYGSLRIERDSYRGGGELAHRILRGDSDPKRLERIRRGFQSLLGDSQSPLGSLARALSQHDELRDEGARPWSNELEFEMEVHGTPWVDRLREGVDVIVTRADDTSESKRIEALILWVPFCVMRHQHSLAMAELRSDSPRIDPLVFDCLPENGPLRNRARADFNRSWTSIKLALKHIAERKGHESLMGGSWTDRPKSFFAQTAFGVGACNAGTGVRWFSMSPALLEAIVLAEVPRPMTFRDFCEKILYRRLGIVIDSRSAQEAGISEVDQSTFRTNAEMFAEMLAELGVLERYSDTTRMVSYS